MFQFFKKKIENTKTISDYKKQYLREKTTESIEALFKELKQSKVWVPFNASLMDGSDEQEGVRLKPDILRKGDDYFYPCFLTEQDIPKDYYDRFSWSANTFYGLFIYCRKDRKVSSERDCSRCIL